MKPQHAALLGIVMALTGCAGVASHGGILAGTDAKGLKMSGNSKTGDWSMEAETFTQSKGLAEVRKVFNGYFLSDVAKNASNNLLGTVQSNNGTTKFLATESRKTAAIKASPTLVPEGVTPAFSPAVAP